MSDESDAESVIDQEEIRAKKSTMSFQEHHKLKEKLGTKLYNETIFGPHTKKKKPDDQKSQFKRVNKNRPREMSSKRPVRQNPNAFKTNVPRDPRFDPLCGTFNQQEFQKSYKFLDNVKKNELKTLKQQLKNTSDPKMEKKIRFLIQRLGNQIKDKERKEIKEGKEYEEKKNIGEKIKKGEKPVYEKKSEKKILNLLNQYEELKKSNKLHKHIEKKSKKLTQKDRKRMSEAFE